MSRTRCGPLVGLLLMVLYLRGIARKAQGKLAQALQDLNEVIRSDARYQEAY